MRTLGLLAGMSWESTIPYYRIINERVRDTLGGLHSARLLMHSVDFAEIEQLQRSGDWEQAGQVLADAAVALATWLLGLFGAEMQVALAAQDRPAGFGEAKRAMHVGFQQAMCDQLAEHAAPLALVEVGADRPGAQAVMAELQYALGADAPQDVDDVRRAEALAAAIHARQRLACRDRAVPALRGFQAVVAVAAGAGVRFAEPAQQ